jgi:hypothetical protein
VIAFLTGIPLIKEEQDITGFGISHKRLREPLFVDAQLRNGLTLK